MQSHDPLYCIRHSLSHILAQSIQRTIDTQVQFGTWPAVENGFYYDVSFSEKAEKLSEDNLKSLQKTMEWVAKEWQEFGLYVAKDLMEAIYICDLLGQKFKKELLQKFAAKGITDYSFWYNYVDAQMLPRLEKSCKSEYISDMKKITKYITEQKDVTTKKAKWDEKDDKEIFITFVDLCEGGHVANTKDIADGSFKLDKIAGAYRQWNENNPQMTRIYGLAFETKEELKKHLEFIEEAKRRDHRVIWAKMKLFTNSEIVGAGLPLFQPNGMIIRKEIGDFLRSLHKGKWYQPVWTPHLTKEKLYEMSWHLEHYKDDLFMVTGSSSSECFCVKPMNCPHHMQIFADNSFSYRDMPVRYFEPGTVYRDEKTGQLWWLTRVRSITQDDGHLFMRPTQIEQEISTIVGIIKDFYKTMGMLDKYEVSLSIRDLSDKSHYLWGDEVREMAESALKSICDKQKLPYKTYEWEAAFYGPKLDFMFYDAIGRRHQLATCQLDFNLPERFDLSYTNEKGEKERPVVVHRAISGSLERFIWVMIEHFAGDFPLWLTPEQVRIIPVVSDKFDEYIDQVLSDLKATDIRAKVDYSDDSFAKKIRNAETDKVYYVLIIWEDESNAKSLSIRNVRTKEQFKVSNYMDFINDVNKDIRNRQL